MSGCIEGTFTDASSKSAYNWGGGLESSERPNIIVVLADDMRADATGFSGNSLIKTPNIDKLAANGTVFDNAYATSAVCTPSRTTLLTGQYERSHEVNFNSNTILENEAYAQTYPMLMKNSGYFVGYIGKNHTPIGTSGSGKKGYKSRIMDNSFDYWYAGHKHLGFYPKDRHAIFKNAKADTQVEILEEIVDDFITPNEAFREGHNFLNDRPKDQPFALLINFNVPHAASTGSMEQRDSDLELYKSAYRDKTDQVTVPDTFVAYKDIKHPKIPANVHNGKYLSTYDYAKTKDDLVERKIREMQTISGVDKFLGKLQDHLEQQGVADNTIIVFTSDHGLMHGEFGLRGKIFLYDPSIKIPLVVYDPRVKDKKVDNSNEIVALVDIAPTLLDFAQVKAPETMQGESLIPLLKGENVKWRQELFLENLMTIQNYPRMEGVRTHEWKYIRYFDKKNDGKYVDYIDASIKGEQPIFEELYDLVNDPQETRNLINEATKADIADQLRKRNWDLVRELRGSR
ncbi:sulfatase-like hydrolase/transferase [Shewanella sp. 10N.7]|uniref:sulfatase-like hydrolase/transferase n=1 Tax=Shewanella sp. 10N.7 TaxID=2885093 RepID=UPI001E49CB0E|nr:sulfatase-like hydrolase/transferase [Shewanella sp. 10N.7]MCC4831808.1 sulfatase-like hydrolase/transferase [Shewanella sp. 10N.7]